MLIMKTNDILRTISTSLGSPINSEVVAARECVRALSAAELARAPWWDPAPRVAAVVDWVGLEARLGVFQLVTWYHSRRR